jgi:hypothetical protein
MAPIGDFNDAIQQHADAQKANANVYFNIGAQKVLTSKCNDKSERFPKPVICKRRLGVLRPQHPVQG